MRRTRALLEMDIGSMELDGLAIVSVWCELNNRVGGSRETIVQWSGYTRNWKHYVNQSIRACFVLGLLETLKVQGGERIALTTKGERVMEVYARMCDVVRGEFEVTREKARKKIEDREMAKLERARIC